MIVFYILPFGIGYIKTSANGVYDSLMLYVLYCVCVCVFMYNNPLSNPINEHHNIITMYILMEDNNNNKKNNK